ncbi:MAG: Mur ligase family protein, partial [Pseudomonadota bacterium]|nr:Mur ligase family protein [Pseudomonadota bacterium]
MAIDRILERLLKLHPKLIDLSLSRLKKLLGRLGNPEENLPPVIHVAGTNGKGSTVATMAAIYRSAGYRAHIYTSPHLVSFTERIVISGSEISKNYLEELLLECENANNGENITFFEITTAAAMLAFSRNPADLLLLEVGLGGRFDATNVIERPMLSVITPVSMDHQDFLGNTIDEIAFEKAGILKPSVSAIIGPQTNEALNVIKSRALELGSSAYVFGEDWNISPANNQLMFKMGSKSSIVPRPNLLGDHQIQNAGCALASVKLLNGQFPVSPQEIEMGLVSINWPARLQKLKEGNLIENL